MPATRTVAVDIPYSTLHTPVSNIFLVAKGENQARHILHRKANYKSDGHRKEDAQNHRQSLRGVDEVSQFQGIVRKNLDTGDSHRGAQKFKDHGNCGGSGHTVRIENIQKDYVSKHHRRIYAHKFCKGIILGHVNAMAGNIHHAAAERSATEHAHCSKDHQGFVLESLAPDSRTQEIHGIVTDTHEQVHQGEQKQYCHKDDIKRSHKIS